MGCCSPCATPDMARHAPAIASARSIACGMHCESQLGLYSRARHLQAGSSKATRKDLDYTVRRTSIFGRLLAAETKGKQ
jgi:hypothetical protein